MTCQRSFDRQTSMDTSRVIAMFFLLIYGRNYVSRDVQGVIVYADYSECGE